MTGVPGAPDPKGFQFGDGGKLVGAGVDAIAKIATSIGDAREQRRKDIADHNKNVSMEQWRMQAQHVLDMRRDQQQQGSNERIAKYQGKVQLGVAKMGAIGGGIEATAKGIAKVAVNKETGNQARTTQRAAVKGVQQLKDSGAREASVTKNGVEASFAPKRATQAKRGAKGQSAQAQNAKAIRKAMRGGKSR
jgi:hypothetical protein